MAPLNPYAALYIPAEAAAAVVASPLLPPFTYSCPLLPPYLHPAPQNLADFYRAPLLPHILPPLQIEALQHPTPLCCYYGPPQQQQQQQHSSVYYYTTYSGGVVGKDFHIAEEGGVGVGFPHPWFPPTAIPVAATLLPPPIVPLQQEELMVAPSFLPPPVHQVQAEAIEPPPLPPRHLQVHEFPSKNPPPPSAATFRKRRVKVYPHWCVKKDYSNSSSRRGIDNGGSRRWEGGRGFRQFGWVPRLRSYRRKSPGEKSYEEFEFKIGEEEGRVEVLATTTGGAAKTTVMIKNLPNKYTREMLLALLDRHCYEENRKLLSSPVAQETPSEYDFFYLPMDFGTGSNLGYAFVNFTSAIAARRLHRNLHKKSWNYLGSRKVCEVTYARIQGLADLVKHFKNSKFECDSDDLLPVYFVPHRNGECLWDRRYVGSRRSTPASLFTV